MAVVKNWVVETVKEIAALWPTSGGRDGYLTNEQRAAIAGNLAIIVQKHCPFKFDAAYVELDHAQDLFKSLKNSECWCEVGTGNPMYNGVHSKACERVQAFMAGAITREGPLLICIRCRNTESPAGAMARHVNTGRCLHCGDYFKVLRG